MEQTECSETSAHKIQAPGNYPKKEYNNGKYVYMQQTGIAQYKTTNLDYQKNKYMLMLC